MILSRGFCCIPFIEYMIAGLKHWYYYTYLFSPDGYKKWQDNILLISDKYDKRESKPWF